MQKIAMKLLIAASTLHQKHHRTDWVKIITIFSTLVTIALVALYLADHYPPA